jgi:HEPN domain-containing protein
MATKPNKIIADPIKTFIQAERFFRADIYLRKNDDYNHMNAIAIPSMVMSAFASELFLKALLTLENGWSPPGHNLKVLFSNVNNKTKMVITDLWDEQRQTPNEVLLRKFTEEHSSTKIPSTLDEAIAVSALAFEKLRYVYEEGMEIQQFFLSNFPIVLRRAIIKVHPEVDVQLRLLSKDQAR